ncbi:MAG: hypothetical protein EZS28_027063 [Streblomastix strix]|uniref:Uncharacterized protein n=1 Tax=Streblomastix strix TaxID=222440 RepID=A0A5J4V4V0_9EUKA|nr:MAG: hypothetical protein EZS28_027063 [Streblomastix strix]
MIRPSILVQHQQQSQVQEPRHVIGRLLDSPGTTLSRKIAWDKQSLWNRESLQRTDQSQFTPIDPPELTINMTQQQFNAHKDFWAWRSYTLKYLSQRSNVEHHMGFGEDEDDYHHNYLDHDYNHDYNHRYEKDRNYKKDYLDLGRGRKRRRVISSEDSGNRQKNVDLAESLHREVDKQQLREFRIQRDRREQARKLIQDHCYMSTLRKAQEEAFRRRNSISLNLVEENSVQWTILESINQEFDTPKANFRTAQQLLAAQDIQEQLNQQVNIQIQQQIKQLHEVNREIQTQQQDIVIINIQQNEQLQQIEVINLVQGIQQDRENTPMNIQQNTNNEAEQFAQTGATHTLQKETPDSSLSETGSLDEQQQQLSLSLSLSSSLIQIEQNLYPSQKQSVFVTDPNHQFFSGAQQSKYISIDQVVNHLPLLSYNPQRQVKIKVCTEEQVKYINKIDEAMGLRMHTLNELSPEEQQRVKRGFGPQMRLTTFYEFQIQRKIAEQHSNTFHIDTSWDFGSGTGVQQDEFQDDFKDETQQLEIRPLDKKNKKHYY